MITNALNTIPHSICACIYIFYLTCGNKDILTDWVLVYHYQQQKQYVHYCINIHVMCVSVLWVCACGHVCVYVCRYSVHVLNRYYALYLCVYGYDALVFVCLSLWLQCTVFVCLWILCTVFVCLSVDTMHSVCVCLWILDSMLEFVCGYYALFVCLWILCTVLVCVCGYCAPC